MATRDANQGSLQRICAHRPVSSIAHQQKNLTGSKPPVLDQFRKKRNVDNYGDRGRASQNEADTAGKNAVQLRKGVEEWIRKNHPDKIKNQAEAKDSFDKSFIGLTGSQAAIDAAQIAANLPVAKKSAVRPDGAYEVGHAAFALAYTKDNLAHVIYPVGMKEEDLSHHLPYLAKETWPSR
jgi:hypothetical protein